MAKKLPIDRSYNILKIVCIYAAFGFLWIYTSDTVLGLLVKDPKITIQIAIFKGSAFIILTSLLLYILIKLYNEKTIKSERAVIASEKSFEQLFQNLADPIYITDLKGKILAANDQSCRELGYTVEEMLQLHISKVDTSADENGICVANLPQQTNSSITFETIHQRKNGSVFPVELNICLIYFSGQQAIMGVARKITERKRAEQKLRQSYELMSYIIRHNTSALAVHDKELKYLFVSERYLNDYKVKDRDVIGKHHYDVFPDLPQKWREVHQKALSGIISRAENDRYVKEDGSEEWTTWECRPWYESNGEVGGFVVYTEVVTDRIKAEEQKQLLQQQLYQAQKMEAIGTLAGGIAHDFNNILGAILGYAEMAYEDSLTGAVNPNDLNQVVEAGHRAKDLVKQILAFSRRADSENILLRPAALVKDSIKLLRASIPTTIDIQHDIDTNSDLVLADPTQINQIIMNLCTNAYQAMEETGGTLSISLKNKVLTQQDLAGNPDIQPGQFVQLSVKDSGFGIAPVIRERIFDPYFTTKEIGKGTGLGLAIVHGIVKSSGGFITCRSGLGVGTVFEVNLPALPEQNVPEKKEGNAIPVGTERILFIDDEEILVKMGQTLLERLGYKVTIQISSIEALATFKAKPEAFDMVITDQTMPGMTGFDLARRMLQVRPGMLIILCTGYSNQVSEQQARSLGIKGFAMKPLAVKDIATLIRQVFDEVNNK